MGTWTMEHRMRMGPGIRTRTRMGAIKVPTGMGAIKNRDRKMGRIRSRMVMEQIVISAG